MATIIKSNARKMLGVGVPSVAYANYTTPNLAEKQHIQILIEDILIRVTFMEWQIMNNKAQQYINEHGAKEQLAPQVPLTSDEIGMSGKESSPWKR